ncbi:Crp/Fnr family transcriptional regulator, partial [Flavobacterium covae]
QKPENIKKKIFIPFTRQEIANFTGLRVETVIRACSKLKKTGIIEIINHKIYF